MWEFFPSLIGQMCVGREQARTKVMTEVHGPDTTYCVAVVQAQPRFFLWLVDSNYLIRSNVSHSAKHTWPLEPFRSNLQSTT